MNVNNLNLRCQEKDKLLEKVPDRIDGLVEMAYNLFWSWHDSSRTMFKKLDTVLWYETRENVVAMLRRITDERLEKMSKSEKFLRLYDKAYTEYLHEVVEKSNDELWFRRSFPDHKERLIAYLSMEYGIHVSVPIYSGGLGVLSGDHLKESSDLGIPIIAVGFLYQEGYFTQEIPGNGWQKEHYHEADWNDLPIVEVMDPENPQESLIVEVDFNDIKVYVKVWMIHVGRVNLFLLDSNIDQNPPWDRDLTDRLYGGTRDLRLKQEMILGIGAVRLLDRLNIEPTVWHLNEGHCVFSSVERIWKKVKSGISFDDALYQVRENTLFTTHTPVPAGHDVFNYSLISNYFNKIYIPDLGRDNFFSLGSYEEEGFDKGFNMTVLGMRTAKLFNGVAELHEQVTKKMFEPLWNELEEKYDDFQPITHVTNGIHVASFLSEVYQDFFFEKDPAWWQRHDDPAYWASSTDIVDKLDNQQIWKLHTKAKIRLLRLMRETARKKIRSDEWDSTQALIGGALFDPEALTIGFARRFATYKRATLIFYDWKRIKRILTDEYRPVQIVFAGKAHPADEAGKKLIQDIINNCQKSELGHRIAFIEDYDLVSAKIMVQGVDIWLNTPRRPNEASGTSGMKASCNFVPNLSILDGWWAEGYEKDPRNGWAINEENKELRDNNSQDWHDVKDLYDILENEIIPCYYDNRDKDDIPVKFVEIMRNAMATTMPSFTSRRMLKDYARRLYIELI